METALILIACASCTQAILVSIIAGAVVFRRG